MKKVCTLLFTCILFLSTFSQNPQLDSTFGEKGFFQEHYGEGAATIVSSARQQNGKIILAGYIEKQVHSLQTKTYTTENWEAFLGRIFPSGLLDSTFGENGFITLTEGYLNDLFGFVNTDSADRIYVMGNLQGNRIIGRYLPDGQLDSTYGINGFYHPVHLLNGRDHVVNAVTLMPDGSTVLAGAKKTELSLTKFKANGRLDTSFNSFGYRIMGNPAAFQRARDMEFLPDGSMLIGGQLAAADALSLAKALPNGEKDRLFGTNGFAQSNINGTGELHGGYFAVKSNGKIIQAGSKNGKIYLFQYHSDGGLDGSFGNGGKRNITARPTCILRDIVIAPGGEILLVGDFPFGSISEVFVICLDENGIPKNSFGNNGFFVMEMVGVSDYGFSLLPQNNGDLLLGGAAGNQATIVRLLSELALNSTHEWGESDRLWPFVYPNPVSTRATLQLELTQQEKLNVFLVNMQGQTVDVLYSGEQFAGKQELDLLFPQSISTGYYLLKIQSEREVAFIKIFIN